MSITAIPLYTTNQLITASHANTYWRDNINGLHPHTAAGDLAYATGADTLGALAIGTAGQILKVNSGATAPEWGSGFYGCCANRDNSNPSMQVVPTGVFTVLEFVGTDLWDDLNFHNPSSNPERITIPADGKYLYGAHIRNSYFATPSSVYSHTLIIISSTGHTFGASAYNQLDTPLLNAVGIGTFNTSDYLYCKYKHNKGVNCGIDDMYFWIIKIG